MRRANGSGGITKLSGKRRKPWMARKTIGWDEDGRQQYKVIGYFATRPEAEQAIALDAVVPVSDNANIDLKGLYKLWEGTRAYKDISKQLRGNYAAVYKHYMNEYHDAKFADLRTPHFQRMVDKAEDAGRSSSTMKKIKTLSVVLCNFAVSQDIALKNYAQFVSMPKHTKKKKIEIFSDLDIKTLIKNDKIDLVDTILILIYTGMRITELLTLPKINVDIKNMLITGGVKTEAGEDRIIPIHPKIQKYIIARYKESENYLIEYTKKVGNKRKGTLRYERQPYRYEYYCDLYFPILEQLGIARLTPHKARHTFFTMLTDKSTDRKANAQVGGHTDPNFTDKTYVQPDVERLRKAVEKL